MAIKLGTNSDDDLFGSSGNDVIFGYNAGLSVQVGSFFGSDIMLGQAGNDLLVDGGLDGALNPDDKLIGGLGKDYIVAESGADTIDAGGGNDVVMVFNYSSASGGIKDAPAGSKLLSAAGGKGSDFLFYVMSGGYELHYTMGSGLNTTLYTGAKISGFETGIIIGGSLRDYLTARHWALDADIGFSINKNFANYQKQITNSTLKSAVADLGKFITAITQYQGFFGSYGGDYLTVELDAKTTNINRGVLLSGDSGDDEIYLSLTQGAVNSLVANDGLFKAVNAAGKKTDLPAIVVDAGEDFFGSDADTFHFKLPEALTQNIKIGQPDGDGVISVTANGKLLEKIQGFEAYNLFLGGGNDTVITGNLDDVIKTFAGNDKITSGDGDDVINAGLGADTIDGGIGTDIVLFNNAVTINMARPGLGKGEAKGDRFTSVERFLLSDKNDKFLGFIRDEAVDGGKGNDILKGGDGRDVLIGGAGNDRLTGGKEADTFRFLKPSGDGIDTVADFQPGVDKLSVNIYEFRTNFIRVVANSNPKPTEPFNAFFLLDTDDGALSFDVDGQGGQAPMQFATLIGVKTLATSDFEFYYGSDGLGNF